MEPRAVIEIALMPDGQLTITGPVKDRVLCYGMLEMAKDAIKAAAERKEPAIAIASRIPFLPNGR